MFLIFHILLNSKLYINFNKIKYEQLFGLFFILILVLIIILGHVYTANINTISVNKYTPAVVPDTSTLVDDLPFIKSSLTQPVDLQKASNPSPENIVKGKQVYETYCTSCHGNEGKGDGLAGVNLKPPPRNFHILTEWTNGTKISEIYKTLEEGIVSRGMAQYNNISPEDRFAVIHYIRTFNKDYPIADENEITMLDNTYSLSKGVYKPAQIPVRTAEKFLISQYNPEENKINSVYSMIELNNSENGALLLKKYSSNLKTLITAIVNNKDKITNDNDFSNFISTSSLQKGFKSEITQITKEELSVIYTYLKNVILK
ncbi:MAG: cytochrome c [Ignavibacteria bacterium]|nr:cytochrome c [Ignavibacteria bacterium]